MIKCGFKTICLMDFFFWEMSNGYGSSKVPITRVGLIILFDWFVWTVIYLFIYILKMQSIEIKMTY